MTYLGSQHGNIKMVCSHGDSRRSPKTARGFKIEHKTFVLLKQFVMVGFNFERTMATHYSELKSFLDLLRDEYKEAVFALDSVPAPLPGLTMLQLKEEPSYMTDPTFRRLVDAYVEASERVRSLDITIKMIENGVFNLSRDMVKPESDYMADGEIKDKVMERHENVVDVVGEPSIQTDAGLVSYNPTFTDTPMELNEFLSRPIQISTFQTAPGAYVDVMLNPWSLYLAQPSVRAKLKNYAYMRATMNIKVVVSGTPFHALQAILAYVPLPYGNEVSFEYAFNAWTGTAFRQRKITWLSQAKGAKVVQIRDNQPVEISAPFVHVLPVISLWKRNQTTIITAASDYDSVNDLGRFFITSPIPLTDCATAPSNASWYIYAYLTDVQLGCPTKTVVEITSEGDEREVGPVERVATAAQQVAESLTSVPWLNPYAKASSIALGALSRISSFFGWSYPVMNNEPMRMKNEPYRNAANTIGYDLGQRITVDPKQELVVDGRVVGVTEDEMSIAAVAGRTSYFTNFGWNQAAAATSPLFKIPIHPSLVQREGLITDIQQPTALAFSATPFAFWRGKIKMRFDVVCTQFHRGKLAFVFEPNVGQNVLIDSTGLTLNKQHVFVLDIQETQTVELCFDWACNKAWLVNPGYIDYTGSVDANQDAYNGYLAVFPLTRLQSPTADSIYVNVYVSGEDMHYNFVNDLKLPITKFESEQIDDFTCVDINPTGSKTDHIHDLHFGEAITSFRALLKRFCLVDTATFTTTTTVGSCYNYVGLTYPPLYPSSVANVPANTSPTLYSYLRPAYLGMRGGMRYRVDVQGPNFGPQASERVYITYPNATASSTGISLSSIPLSPLAGTIMFAPATNGGVEFEVPFYSNLLFVTTNATNSVDTGSVTNLFNRNFVVQMDAQPDTTGGTNKAVVHVYAATGEDFTFLRFLGATPFKY